ncbi:two-component regulator propeller domain-containing protein [Dyella silvatica]|uniref:sensor histidine kinase n=1 Tax=Dyella silvatica TaxID=2992128 RepID=UPI0022517E36|nr:two-component regulator propeller domain-containing protein [Dyella silvatica]
MSPAFAQRSNFRIYDQSFGLNSGEVQSLAQDDQGFLWLGTSRGLVRFDGREFLSWAPHRLDELVRDMAYGPHDELLLRTENGGVLRRVGDDLLPLKGPDAAGWSAVTSLDFDGQGRLWLSRRNEVWWRDRQQSWHRFSNTAFGGQSPLRLHVRGDCVDVFTDQGLWCLHTPDVARELLHAPGLWLSAGGSEGRPLWVSSHLNNGLWMIDSAGVHDVGRPLGRAMDMLERGHTVWLALDRLLLAIEPDGRLRQIGVHEGLPSGGPLLEDREHSLWLGTFVGLLQFPEPDTWQWGEEEGLPSMHSYDLAEADGQLWVATWLGLARFSTPQIPRRFIPTSQGAYGRICVDAQRDIWVSDGHHLLAWRGNQLREMYTYPSRDVVNLGQCATGTDGTLWFATDQGLLRLNQGARQPQPVTLLPSGQAPDVVWIAADGAVQVADTSATCRLHLDSDSSAHREACVPNPGEEFNSATVVTANAAWLAASNGLYAYDGKSVLLLPGSEAISGVLENLTKAPSGGWWAAGVGALLRVMPCDACAAKWEVQESLGIWHGLPGNSSIEALELANGDLWIAGNRGVWRVPRAVRNGSLPVPRIVPVRARIDGQEQPADGAVELAPSAHRLDLEFAALSFRDRSLLRFRSRLLGQGGWSVPTRLPVLQFAALEPGDYQAEMSASLDGQHWSETPADIRFRVLPPWYRTYWARALFVLAALALVILIYQMRVTALLRVERERTRIAMDLHDELGSGLGSIGMLASLAARAAVETEERRRLAGQIATVAELLGGGLRSLVWTLRSGRAGIAELGQQLADHARRLFPGEHPSLQVRLPIEPSATTLKPEVRRHVLLLALEALHNIARHADAAHVELELLELDDGGLQLTIEDDGYGFDPDADVSGTGLESMRRRAAAIGARLDIVSTPGFGSRIRLDYVRRAHPTA